jgi:hypothetical protein
MDSHDSETIGFLDSQDLTIDIEDVVESSAETFPEISVSPPN